MENDLLKQPIIWVESNRDLETVCESWLDLPLLAIDTEFMRSTTYYPITGLIQINDGEQNYLIDPTKIDDWYPLIEVLDSDDCIVALHSCSEDIEVLNIELGTVPMNILDTQIAAAFLGYEASLGYANLVQKIIGAIIPKTETRSDWLQRPLSQPQKYYAALDVEYLFQIAKGFIETLSAQGRLDWVLEEGRRVFKNFKKLQDINQSYMRIKSAWKLDSERLTVLIALARWRENKAQQKDMPRNRILKEPSLLDIAQKKPEHISELRGIEGVSERIIRQDGEEIIRLTQNALEFSEETRPSVMPKPLDKSERGVLLQIREEVKLIAESLGIAPEVMLKKKQGEDLVRFYMAQEWGEIEHYFNGWRSQCLSAPLAKKLRGLN